MNTFKTTACVLSIATAGFAMETSGGDGDENFNPNRPQRMAIKSASNTPVKPALNTLVNTSVSTPMRQQQTLNVVTPRQNGTQNQFLTPQNQRRPQIIPGAPDAPTQRIVNDISTPDMNDRLVSSMPLSPIGTPEAKKSKYCKETTTSNSKKNVLLTIVSDNGNGSPTSIADLSHFDRLTTNAYTPAAFQFTKNIGSRT